MRWKVGFVVVAATLVAVVPVATPVGARSATPGSDHGDRAGLDRIQHVVVLMQENRSYDSYFGPLHFEGQPFSSVEPDRGNPDPTNPPHRIRPFHNPALCEVADLSHSWNNTHREWDGGRMDGFTAANVDPADPSGHRTMASHDQADLPFYYALANTFGIGDRYFASVLGPTYPNRYYLLAGTSFGHIGNDFPPAGGWTQKTVFELLDVAGVSWRIYDAQLPFGALFAYVQQHFAAHVFPISQYYADAAAGALPQVAFVDPVFLGRVNVENDEHPPANVQVGEQFTAGVLGALMRSPNWPSSALFLTYDEHGGFYDHVPSPPAPVPDAIAPMLGPRDRPGAFDRYGVRVPTIVVSPYSRPHFVSDVVHDHTSILRFIEVRFGLPALTNRDAVSSPMLEFFDFSHPAFAKPPTLPPAPLDPVRTAQCAALHPSAVGSGL